MWDGNGCGRHQILILRYKTIWLRSQTCTKCTKMRTNSNMYKSCKNAPNCLTYIKRFKGRPEEVNLDANFLTEVEELRSNSMVSTLAPGIFLTIASLTSFPAAIFLTPIITFTPRNARTRAVSEPIPLDAPNI